MLFDSGIVETISTALPVWLAVLILFLSYLGSVYVIAPSVLAGYLFGNRKRTATWLGIIITAYALFVAVKPLTAIPRPTAEPPLSPQQLPSLLVPVYNLGVDFDTGSFPSGHVLATTVFWGLITLDLDVSTFRRRLLAGITVVTIVAFSRVALAVHYLGDVIGGFLLGIAVLAVGVFVRTRATNPVAAVLALAVIPALAGIALGRVIDGSVLLLAIGAVYLADSQIDEEWRPALSLPHRK